MIREETVLENLAEEMRVLYRGADPGKGEADQGPDALRIRSRILIQVRTEALWLVSPLIEEATHLSGLDTAGAELREER